MPSSKPKVRALAFVLPQFHPIPENDQWWGKGFTEWTNVTKARPNFTGHEQPHEPADLGYYDLRVAETKAQQAEMAARYGIHGFCYYYYWFAGKRLLYRPLEQILESGEPDFPFCLCWANESWSRAWDGRSGEVLIEQKHSEEDHLAFIHSVIPFFRDQRYIRVNGRPLLLIYRIGIIPDVQRAVEIWREECLKAGVGDPWLVAVQSHGLGDPTPHGFDAASEFPPHGTLYDWDVTPEYRDRLVNPEFSGRISDIRKTIDHALELQPPAYTLYRGVMPRWDNTARRQNNGLIFVNSTPENYEEWLTNTVRYTCEQFWGDERLLFINAWNEWAEGCHLEPDTKYGHQYLEATRRALFSYDESARKQVSASRPVSVMEESAATPYLADDEPMAAAQDVAVDTVDIVGAADVTDVADVAPESSESTEARAGRRLRIGPTLRWIYRRLPVSPSLKMTVVHGLFATAPALFKHTAAYKHWDKYRVQVHVPRLETQPMDVARATPELAREIRFTEALVPRVSIIVPVYGKISYTLHCLRSIQDSKTKIPFEVIVIDDCSPDETAELLALVEGLRVVRNETNLGFLRNCNKAAKLARGNYLLFLNNDTQVHPGWLDALYDTFAEYPQAGLVGSRLVYPTGRQQEAGGVIWRDASGLNYGRDDDPMKPEYCFVRDVDYCSGASIMVPRALFDTLGGFDERFAPAYYEDTDLAFAVRKAGYRVLYQPFSVVIHFEGITSGTDINKGVKSFQRVNQHKMRAKWQDVLDTHGSAADGVWLMRQRTAQRLVLVSDWQTPRPDRDSGSVDTLNYMRMLQALGFKVVFCPYVMGHDGDYTRALQRMGIECLYQPYVPSLEDHLREYGVHYDLVLLQRAPMASLQIKSVRRYCRNAKVIFNTVDLHFVRERRRAEVEKSARLAIEAERTKVTELAVMRQCDATIVISAGEQELLQQEVPEVRVAAIPYVREVHGSAAAFDQRRDIVFIGGFLHNPNTDALTYFVHEIWPLIRHELPDIRLLIVGGNIPPEVLRLGNEPGIDLLGFVEHIGPVFNRCRLSIAPLRYGAGIKGKIGTSLCYGVPCVATPLAAEGMGLEDHVSVMLGHDAATFARAVIDAYEDEVLWSRLSTNGLELFEHEYSLARGLERLGALLASLGLTSR